MTVIFIVWIAFISLERKITWIAQKRMWKKDFCNLIIPSEDTKILEFNEYQKLDKAPCIIYADLECIIEMIDGSKNIHENSSAAKVSKHIPSGFSINVYNIKIIGNKNDAYKGKGCMKKFCEFLRKPVVKITNFKKKKNEIINKKVAAIIWKY